MDGMDADASYKRQMTAATKFALYAAVHHKAVTI